MLRIVKLNRIFILAYSLGLFSMDAEERSVIDMLLNKKCVYLGVTLFSALVLGGITTNQTVKADTTGDTTTSTTSSTSSTTSSPTTTSVTSPATSTTTTGTTTAPATSTTATGTTTAPSTSTTTTSTITIPSTSSTTTTSETTSPTTTTTSPTTSPATTTGTGTTGTSTTTSTATTGTNPYAIPSDVTDSTVVNFADPLLGAAVKSALNIPSTSPITVGAIKGYVNPTLGIMMTSYEMDHPADGSAPKPGESMSDQQDTPIESLDGMQYLQLLPTKTQVLFQAMLASDEKANTDLRPLDGINFGSLALDGNFSDPDAKEIDLSQIDGLNTTNATLFELVGDSNLSPTSGLNNQELVQAAPAIIKFADNGQSYHTIELGYTDISDFTPLQGVEAGQGVSVVAVSNTIDNPTPVYAVTGQPITFTAPKLLDLDGKDIADTYHYSSSVLPADLKDGNLINNGGDSYTLMNADPAAKNLTYGQIGFADYTPDSLTYETKGTTTFEAVTMNSQPLTWQAHPTVTIHYLDPAGQPILNSDGTPMTKTVDGDLIGDSYDLTADSQVAGYTLTSPTSLLKGTYTQTPQAIDLSYTAASTGTYSGTTGTSQTTVPSTSTTQPSTTTQATPTADGESIQVHELDPTSPSDEQLIDMGVRATTHIDGQLFYLVGYGQWVLASDYNNVASPTSGVVRTFDSSTGLVNSYGQPVSEKLMPNTEWKYSKIVTINGDQYYQVATDEFLPVHSGVEFVSTKATVKTTTRTTLYDSQGRSLSRALSSGSSWYTDGYAIINGVKMYRVATDEWIPASDVI